MIKFLTNKTIVSTIVVYTIIIWVEIE